MYIYNYINVYINIIYIILYFRNHASACFFFLSSHDQIVHKVGTLSLNLALAEHFQALKSNTQTLHHLM